jgi:predicted dehydrogenase
VAKLGVALLGLDHWYAAFHLAPAIAGSERVRLVAVAHDDAAKAQQVAQANGAELWTTDARAALERHDVDIVVALYSTDRNVAICEQAAALGKHIVSVKPMALDLAGADRIVQAVRAAGVHFFPLDSSWRLRADAQQIKRWIAEGRIGQPLRYLQTLNSSLPLDWPGGQEASWWIDPARVPGGAWIDHAIYAVDMMRWLLDSEPIAVSGTIGNQRHTHLQLEDYGLATYTLANGATAVIEDTWTADRGFGYSRSEILGSAGAVVDDTSTWGRIGLRGNFGFDGWISVRQIGERSQPLNAVDHLAACVRGEQSPIATVADGRANLAACLAFYQAARTGASVRL